MTMKRRKSSNSSRGALSLSLSQQQSDQSHARFLKFDEAYLEAHSNSIHCLIELVCSIIKNWTSAVDIRCLVNIGCGSSVSCAPRNRTSDSGNCDDCCGSGSGVLSQMELTGAASTRLVCSRPSPVSLVRHAAAFTGLASTASGRTVVCQCCALLLASIVPVSPEPCRLTAAAVMAVTASVHSADDDGS